MNNTLEIKIQDLKNLNKEEYLLVDIREEAAFAHGFIPNAVNIPLSRLREKPELLPNDKKIILYCAKGILSYEAAEELEEKCRTSCRRIWGMAVRQLFHRGAISGN